MNKPRAVKTRAEITKANLAKTLTKMKKVVAEREELWLELFQDLIGLLIGDETEGKEGKILEASMLADLALEQYESRWGQGGSKGEGKEV